MEFKKDSYHSLLTDVENCAIPYRALKLFTKRTEYSEMKQGPVDLHLVRDGTEVYYQSAKKLLEKT
jgi:hypothetical protein